MNNQKLTDKQMTLNTSLNELGVILQALSNMPYGKVAPLIDKIVNKINAENQPVSEGLSENVPEQEENQESK